jgi:single-strand DNA-binding protein
MRKMIVSGHLGMDPEIKTTNRGTQYTTFRIANHEYADAEGVTYWFTVTVWEPSLQNFCKSLKKGSLVYVDGEYTDRTYTSNKTGQIDVGRDLRATAIYFGQGGGKREDDSQVAQTAPMQETPMQTTSEQAQDVAQTSDITEAKKTRGKTKSQPAAPEPSDAENDDLPF